MYFACIQTGIGDNKGDFKINGLFDLQGCPIDDDVGDKKCFCVGFTGVLQP